MLFVVAFLIPQSRNNPNVIEGINAIEYIPYSAGDITRARIMEPIANKMLDIALPIKSWKLPVADAFPMVKALSKKIPALM